VARACYLAAHGAQAAMAGTDRGEVRAAGTLERIAAVFADGEERTAFIRQAVEREIERRQKAAGERKSAPRKSALRRADSAIRPLLPLPLVACGRYQGEMPPPPSSGP
jgi:hypothetical protein